MILFYANCTKEVYIMENSGKYGKNGIENRRKYMENNYKNLQVQIKKEDYVIIDNFCKINGISKAQFISGCCMYFINKNELPPN